MFENRYSKAARDEKDGFMTALLKAGLVPHDQTQTVYKYVSANTARIILENSSLRFSSPLLFNDPFEMNSGFVDFEVPREELLRRINANLINRSLSPQERDVLQKRFSNEDLTGIYKEGLEIQRQRILLLCSSRTYQSILMWSHYADSHKGVCIGFKVPTIDPDLNLFSFNVNYVKKLKPFSVLLGNEQLRSIALYRWINTKYITWKYEQEVRTTIPNLSQMVTPENFYTDVEFNPSVFTEIYFGAGIDPKHKADIFGLIKEKGYSIEKFGSMSIGKSAFNLECTPME